MKVAFDLKLIKNELWNAFGKESVFWRNDIDGMKFMIIYKRHLFCTHFLKTKKYSIKQIGNLIELVRKQKPKEGIISTFLRAKGSEA